MSGSAIDVDACNGSTFHRQSQCDAKNPSFFAVGAAVRTRKIAVRRLSASTRMAPNILAFGPFLRLSNDEKWLVESRPINLQVHVAFDIDLHPAMSPTQCFHAILLSGTLLVCTSKSPLL